MVKSPPKTVFLTVTVVESPHATLWETEANGAFGQLHFETIKANKRFMMLYEISLAFFDTVES